MWPFRHGRPGHDEDASTRARREAENQLNRAHAQRARVDEVERAGVAAATRHSDFTAAVQRVLRGRERPV